MRKINLKKAFVILSIVKLPLTIYLIASLLMVPSINSIQAKFIQGAHRGASLDFEENTLEAFNKAVEEPKYQFIEFDIQYTKDHKIAVFHQNTMYRIPKNFVETSEMEYSELLSEFDFKIPQYHEVMNCIKQSKPINVEIKSHGNPEEDNALADFVIADFKERGIINQLLLSSPEEKVIEHIETNYPEIKTSRIFWVTPYSILPFEFAVKSFYGETKADYLSMHGYNLQNYETLQEFQPENKGIMFWYFTDEMYIPQNQGEFNQFWEDIEQCIEDSELIFLRNFLFHNFHILLPERNQLLIINCSCRMKQRDQSKFNPIKLNVSHFPVNRSNPRLVLHLINIPFRKKKLRSIIP